MMQKVNLLRIFFIQKDVSFMTLGLKNISAYHATARLDKDSSAKKQN